jgi:acyl-CoA thioester hydrolase
LREKRIEIRWRDLDAYAHVNQAVYQTYVEETLDDWLRGVLGISPEDVWSSRPLSAAERKALESRLLVEHPAE